MDVWNQVFDDASHMVSLWVYNLGWPTLTVIAVSLLGLLWVGCWLGRRVRPAKPTARRAQLRSPRSWWKQNWWVPVLFSLCAVGTTWSLTGNWLAEWSQSGRSAGWVEAVQSAAQPQIVALVDQATAYNEDLANSARPDRTLVRTASAADYQAYQGTLLLPGQPTGSMIGQLVIPSIGMQGMPIYHGTEDSVLAVGAGHLYGSSLPGAATGHGTTNVILSGHSGLIGADLFTYLPDIKVGDRATIYAAGRAQTYEVFNTEVVLAADAPNSMVMTTGSDELTLFTCTPLGVNTHRFIAHARLVDVGTFDRSSPSKELGVLTSPGFPWWLLVSAAVVAGLTVLVWLPNRRRSTQSESAGAA